MSDVPHLRFPEFTEEWNETTIGKIANILCGYAFNGTSIVEEVTNSKLLRGVNITEGTIRHSSDIDRYFMGDINSKLDKYLLIEGDLVIGMDGSKVGKNSAIITADEAGSYLVQRVCRIRTDIVKTQLIYQQVNNPCFHRYVDNVKTSSAIPHISQSDITNYSISIPKNRNEQNKIARFLSIIDERIATQNKIIEDLKKLKSAINDTLQERYCHSQRLSFAEIGNSYSGLSGKSSADFGEGYPYIPYTNIFSNDIVNEADMAFVKIKPGESQNRVQYGDILFTLSSETPEEVGMGAVYLGNDKDVFLNSFSFGIHIERIDVIYPPYLAYYIVSRKFRKFICPFAQGSTRFNLQKQDFENAEMDFPDIDAQRKIYTTLSAITAKIKQEEKILERWRTQKQWLLARLFI